MDPRSEDSWNQVARTLRAGDRSEDARARFWMVVDAWIRDLIMDGPDNDLARCRLRGRFRPLFPDVHAAMDFVADLVVERLGQWEGGRFDEWELEELDRRQGLARVASSSFVRLRSLTWLSQQAGVGVVGLPAESGSGWSIDGPEGAGLAAELESDAETDVVPETLRDAVEAIDGGGRVFRLDDSAVDGGAVAVTAALQLLPRLVLDDPANRSAIDSMRSEAVSTAEGLAVAHRVAARELEDRVQAVEGELFDHPGMQPARVALLERRIVRLRADLVVQPLAGRTVAEIFDLATANAGEQRNTKYRTRLSSLLPDLAGLLADGEEGH